MTISRLLISPVVLFLTNLVTAQKCTPCFGGYDMANPSGQSAVGQQSCSFFATFAPRADEGTVGCQVSQMATYQGCGCPEYDEQTFCAMCDGGFYDIGNWRNRPVPLLPGSTCGDWLFPRRDSEEDFCGNTDRVAHYCGCPNATEPVCSFCPAGNSPARSEALLPPHYNITCNDMHVLAPFSITNETCEAFKADSPIDTEFYCGCDPFDTAPGTCSLCGITTMMFTNLTVDVGPVTMTCAEVGHLAETAIDPDFCTSLIDEYFAPCCLGVDTDPPTSTSAPEKQSTIQPTFITQTSAPTEASGATAKVTRFWMLVLGLGTVLEISMRVL